MLRHILRSILIWIVMMTYIYCSDEVPSISYYKDQEALVFDLPSHRVVLLETEAAPFHYVVTNLDNKQALSDFCRQLERLADSINSGDLLQRDAAFSSLASTFPFQETKIYRPVEKKLLLNHYLPVLFATVKDRNQRELLVVAKHLLNKLEQKQAVDEVAKAFREFDSTHPIFHAADWFDYALACYFSGKLTDGELCALGVLSTLVSYHQPEDVVGIKIIPLDSHAGAEFFSRFYQGIIQQNEMGSVYRALLSELAGRSPVEKLIFRISFSKKPCMQPFNEFVLQGACYYNEGTTFHLIQMMPFAFHSLLKTQFGDNVQPLYACFGYSEDLKYWRQDKRPISVPCTRIPVMSCVHNQKISHLLETLVHDMTHQVICSYIPKHHRSGFRKVAHYLEEKLQELGSRQSLLEQKLEAIKIYFYDMPFLYYTRGKVPSELAFYISFVVAIYRTVSTKWENSFIDELISLALYQKESDPHYVEESYFTECDSYLDNTFLSEKMRSQIQADRAFITLIKEILHEASYSDLACS